MGAWLNKKKCIRKKKVRKYVPFTNLLNQNTTSLESSGFSGKFMKFSPKKETLSHWQSWRRTCSLLVITREYEAGESEKMKRHFMSQGSKVDLNMEDSFTFSNNVWKYSGDWSLQWQACNIFIKTQAHINMNDFENTEQQLIITVNFKNQKEKQKLIKFPT